MNDFTHVDLFSGIGGFSLASRLAGFNVVQFVEKDEFCQQVLAKNFPLVPIHSDIKTYHLTSFVNLITAGFPCQPFSVSGKRRGQNDDRYLWPEVIRIIRESRPDWFIGENVPGIIPMLDPILEDLEKEGYSWRAYIIPASLIGAPHKRERVFIIANSNRKRCYDGGNNRQEGYVFENIQRYIQKVQSEWTQFIPESWQAFNAQDWITNTDSKSSIKTNTKSKSESIERNARMGYSGQNGRYPSESNWEKDKPPIPGVDDGIPNIVDRNKSLGNAIVPALVYPFMVAIKEVMNE